MQGNFLINKKICFIQSRNVEKNNNIHYIKDNRHATSNTKYREKKYQTILKSHGADA